MKKILLIMLLILSFISCDKDNNDVYNVIQVEKGITTYINEQNYVWDCKECVIFTNKTEYLMFPIEYIDNIKPGTLITYHCHQVISYKNNDKFIFIDWDGTKREKGNLTSLLIR